MRIPLSWLKEFLSLPESATEIAEVLTKLGIEVDHIEESAPSFSGVVAAEVRSTAPHPNAERLLVASISDGTHTYSIVCGDQTLKAGLRVPLAKAGAILTDAEGKKFPIKKGKLRGIESEGMLCSMNELGLSNEDGGVGRLSPLLPLGTDLAALHTETIFMISLTPNLGHCMSVLGIARELSAALDRPYQPLHEPLIGAASSSSLIPLTLSIDDPEGAYQYATVLLDGLEVKPSKEEVQKRLIASGLRPINNIVDAVNLTMLEMGQPMHAFDFDKIEGEQISVSLSSEREEIETLDGIVRSLPQGTLLISDGGKPLAIAGIMGGKNSMVSESTTRILLEAAQFNPKRIRKSSKELGLRTDSSSRFERGIDPSSLSLALKRAAAVIIDSCGGRIASALVKEQVGPYAKRTLTCRCQRVNALLGTQLSETEIQDFLSRLEIETLKNNEGELIVSIPSYRNDLAGEIDLIEEVARIYGYHHIDYSTPPLHISSTLPDSPLFALEKRVRSALLAEGLQELITCDLISPSQAALMDSPEALIAVLQPSSIDQSILRPSLLPSLLQTLQYNADRQQIDLKGFEIGRVHFRSAETIVEKPMIALLLSGLNHPHHIDPKPRLLDFFDLKGIMENLFRSFKVPSPSWSPSSFSFLHPTRQAHVRSQNEIVGICGQIHPRLTQRPTYFAEIDLQLLGAFETALHRQMNPLSEFFGSERDWTVTLPRSQPIGELLTSLENIRSHLLKSWTLLDIYTGKGVPEDQKNVSFRFLYRDDKKTVDGEGVEKEHKRILSLIHLNTP